MGSTVNQFKFEMITIQEFIENISLFKRNWSILFSLWDYTISIHIKYFKYRKLISPIWQRFCDKEENGKKKHYRKYFIILLDMVNILSNFRNHFFHKNHSVKSLDMEKIMNSIIDQNHISN